MTEPIHDGYIVVMTLEELKQKNAQEDSAQEEAHPLNTDDTGLQADNAEPLGGDPENDGEDAAQEIPLWMQADEQESATSDQMPVKSHIAVKQKLKSRLSQKDSEIDQLRQEIQQIKGTAQPVAQPLQPPTQTAMPKAEDFYDQRDPDASFQLAMQNWVNKGVEQKLNSHLQTHQQQQQRQQQDGRLNQELDRHYDRAAKIVSEGMLSEDEYRDSETLLRQSVDHVAPGRGDAYVDSLLGRMGDGSEKVVVSLARNASHMTAFQQALRDDPTGITAAAFLGELKGRFRSAGKVSKTPRPGSKLNGDAPVSGGADMRRYNTAHKSGNRQEAFNIKRAAKARGVDVSKW